MHGEIVAEHRRIQAGAGQTVRSPTTPRCCRRRCWPRLRPRTHAGASPTCRRATEALAELARLRGIDRESTNVISLEDYAQLAQARGQTR